MGLGCFSMQKSDVTREPWDVSMTTHRATSALTPQKSHLVINWHVCVGVASCTLEEYEIRSKAFLHILLQEPFLPLPPVSMKPGCKSFPVELHSFLYGKFLKKGAQLNYGMNQNDTNPPIVWIWYLSVWALEEPNCTDRKWLMWFSFLPSWIPPEIKLKEMGDEAVLWSLSLAQVNMIHSKTDRFGLSCSRLVLIGWLVTVVCDVDFAS